MILVTGATGQTGSELVRRLSQRGVAVRALYDTLARVFDVKPTTFAAFAERNAAAFKA